MKGEIKIECRHNRAVVYVNGAFFYTADTVEEAMRELR